ncbi:hypothetical protein, partial [Streptomyces thermolineatus]|uniref:hypothetical protein n=1 Tax=Streptomyces thermolineatus TaxID=44033 RepID=UPI0031CEE6AE
WATSCPPPRHNFSRLPRIRSESPAFDLHHPDIVALGNEGKDIDAARRSQNVLAAPADPTAR